MTRWLRVRGAREHNLKSVDVDLPRESLVVLTGPSGSGKSSLAFDTIYAEGQRRYVESLSAYARQFLDRLPKPRVDSIEGLSPAISIEQKAPSRNPRSTVATVTEIHDYLRLLYARVGEPFCPSCGEPIEAHTVQRMVDEVLGGVEGARFTVLAPIVRNRKGRHGDVLARLRREGFVRVRVDGELRDLGDDLTLAPKQPHTLEVVVDRLAVKGSARQRLTESVELAAGLADGLVRIAWADGGERLFSERFACPDCDVALPELTPALFSFNGPQGACPRCGGLGETLRFEAERAIPRPELSVAMGAVAPWGKVGGPYHRKMVETLEARLPGFPLETPVSRLDDRWRRALIDGDGEFEGVLPGLARRLRDYERRRREQGGTDAEERTAEFLEEELGRFASRGRCEECGGARLRSEALAVKVAGVDIATLAARSVVEARATLRAVPLEGARREVGEPVLRELDGRLGFLEDVGLDYLTLDRRAATLSGGEAERIRLATQIGSGLTGVLYVLDEPSVGLHPRDNDRLLATLASLRDRGNTVLVVEHDEATVRAADFVVDMGPGAGRSGGEVVAYGTVAEILDDPRSLTGAYLSGRRGGRVPRRRRRPRGALRLRGARLHNLQGVDVEIPLGVLVGVSGVSGSGKSSLIVDTLVPALRATLAGERLDALALDAFEGAGGIDKLVAIDQSPIGRTPRSNPASYTGLLTPIRELYASLPESKARGYGPGRFSFNVKGGRCEACQGDGVVRVEMHFLPDVYVTCDVCRGLRYNRETLEVSYRGWSIADVLAATVDEALERFEVHGKIRDRLRALADVGLGYVQLGQSATTLSGGEAQRVKLARELARKATGATFYVLDEPTTGLHASDVEVLLAALERLVEAGNSVLVVEHDLDVLQAADFLVDLGPEGGSGGGRIVAVGTPEDVAAVGASHTGRWLGPRLARGRGESQR